MTSRAAAKTAGDKIKDAENHVEDAGRETLSRMNGFAGDSQQTMAAQMEKASKTLEGFSAIGQTNLDAFVKSSEIATRAAEGIGSEVSAYTKKAFEESVAAAQDIAASKTMTELFEKQTSFAQIAFDGWIQQSSKMTDICVAAAKDIAAPFSASMASAADRAKSVDA